MSNTHYDVLLAGAFAAFTVDLLVYPLDTLKTRFQSPQYNKIYFDASKNAINKEVLFRGLYQGIGSVILITIPSSGAFFTTYEGVKSLLGNVNPTCGGGSLLVPEPVVHSAASAVAELVSCFILTPAEVLKQNAQMFRQSSNSAQMGRANLFQQSSVTLEALKHFKKPTQLWRGYGALAARNLPFTAMQFPLYEHLKIKLKSRREKQSKSTGSLMETAVITAVSAGSAGSLAAVITTPIDVVKTRIMLSAAGEGSAANAPKEVNEAKGIGQSLTFLARRNGGVKKSGFEVAQEVFAEAGMKGLFRGAILRAVWTALGSGLYLGVYESGKMWLGHRHEGDI
ncbi:mitochondrial carrier protein-like protein [Coleophoma cylindrospora]|uniref:Mitochondrial carrier protein-like protein n=1 Tax=Coleophoma cylindrospora TaxID=1849047 RepID=A0A3D8QWS1_9HELO|nr:mitochondrial carrier protein-like protein [Coleophoma cylindrospora]